MFSLSQGFARAVALGACRANACRTIATSSQMFKGHSKWQNIKATKGKNDMIKSQTTNLLLRKVRSAVQKPGGYDVKLNTELSGLEQEFKKQGLSLDTFKNFLVKLKEKPDHTFHFDVIGPNGTFFIIQADAPQRNHVEGAIRKYFNKLGGFRIAADGSGVRSWFSEKGVITVATENSEKKTVQLDEIEETGIEIDCEEVSLIEDDGQKKFELICEPRKTTIVEGELDKRGYLVESAEVEFRPMHPVVVSEEDQKKIEKLYEFLQEDDFVTQIFDNIEPSQ